MQRLGLERQVYFFEEPVVAPGPPRLATSGVASGVTVVVPCLPQDLDEAQEIDVKKRLLNQLCQQERLVAPLLWYYTPMSSAFSSHLEAEMIVYDCMDSLPPFAVPRPSWLEQRASAAAARGRGVHRWLQPLRGQAAPARATFTRSPAASTSRTFGRARAAAGARRTRRPSRIRASGTTPCSTSVWTLELVAAIADARPDWQLDPARAGGEDRPRESCRAGPTSIISAANLRRAAGLPGGLGRRRSCRSR